MRRAEGGKLSRDGKRTTEGTSDTGFFTGRTGRTGRVSQMTQITADRTRMENHEGGKRKAESGNLKPETCGRGYRPFRPFCPLGPLHGHAARRNQELGRACRTQGEGHGGKKARFFIGTFPIRDGVGFFAVRSLYASAPGQHPFCTPSCRGCFENRYRTRSAASRRATTPSKWIARYRTKREGP